MRHSHKWLRLDWKKAVSLFGPAGVAKSYFAAFVSPALRETHQDKLGSTVQRCTSSNKISHSHQRFPHLNGTPWRKRWNIVACIPSTLGGQGMKIENISSQKICLPVRHGFLFWTCVACVQQIQPLYWEELNQANIRLDSQQGVVPWNRILYEISICWQWSICRRFAYWKPT